MDYEPAESSTGMFGGNSNWRGPVWFPVNYLMIESLQRFHHYFGDELQVEFPTGSGVKMNLCEVAANCRGGCRAVPARRDMDGRPGVRRRGEISDAIRIFAIIFCSTSIFHGDNGAGLGASHQTGWTALVAKLLQQSGE